MLNERTNVNNYIVNNNNQSLDLANVFFNINKRVARSGFEKKKDINSKTIAKEKNEKNINAKDNKKRNLIEVNENDILAIIIIKMLSRKNKDKQKKISRNINLINFILFITSRKRDLSDVNLFININMQEKTRKRYRDIKIEQIKRMKI